MRQPWREKVKQGTGIGSVAFAIITINTICWDIPILLAKHGPMGQSDERKFNALWKTAITRTTCKAIAKTKFNWYAPSNWQTVIICHVYRESSRRHWHKVESKTFAIRLTLPFILITWTVYGWQLFFFVIQFLSNSPFLFSTDKHSSVVRSASVSVSVTAT